MAASASGLVIWTTPGMKVHLQTLMKLSELGARARVSTWQRQRDQIMAWVTEHVSELQQIPAEVEALTEALIEAELFTVDVAGALALGPWPVEAGTWAARKVIEAEKFGVVSEWARSILALRVPVLASATPGAVAGGAGASGGGAVAPSGALAAPAATAAGGSGAGAHAGGGPGGGVPGVAGAQGALGAGTIASAIAAPGAGASVLTPSVTATTVGTGTTVGSAAGGGPGGGVPAGTAGAQGGLGVGTVASAAAAPSAGTHAVDPQSIAAAIAAAVGARLDALGERLATLEAQRVAAGAPAVLSGAEPAEAVELWCGIRDSVATVEGWDVPRCVQACTDLVHEAAKLWPQLTALRTIHPFGKTPMRTLEAHAFEPLAYILPELRAEECELDELPPGSEATVEHWRAFVHLLQARVGEFQRFVKSQVPSFPITDVMVPSFFRKRKRVTFEGEEEEARAAGGGHGSLPPLDAARRDRLATLGAGFRTVNEEQLARALRGELAPEDVVRPPVQRLQQEDEGRLKLKDGELTMVAKKKKCKDFSEWERGFLRILCEAPAEARDDLMDFVEWARTIAAEFSFYHFNKFYEHLVRQVQRSATGISLDGYARVWRVYMQTTGLKEKVARKPRDRYYSWRRDAEEPKPTVPEDAGGGRGKGKGGGGRGGRGGRGGGLGGRGGISDACYGHNEGNCEGLIPAVAVPLGEPGSSSGAPAGAEGVPVAAPDPMVEADAELEFGQPIAVEDIVIDLDEPYRVPNYVGPEHIEVMREEIRRESEDGHIFLAGWRLPLGVIALGKVEKLEHDEFTTVKEAYGMMRPGYWMVMVDLEAAYRSVGIASQFWPHQCFEFDGVEWMDARAPFGNRALPGIFMRWTRAIVAWMRARGIPMDGYLDDFFCVLETREQAEEAMMLLVEFVTFLGFKVNSAKCEGPAQVLEFLGVLLDTSGEVCTASIDQERIAVVVQKAGDLRAQAARGMVARRRLESLLGLLAFCSHVVWALSLYTRRGFTFLTATAGRRMVRLPRPVLDDLSVLERVVRRYNGRKIFFVRAQHDIRLQPVYIDTKDNLLADLLSRLDMPQFLTKHKSFLRADIWRQDRDDWMWGTAACFLVPVWDGDAGWELVKTLPQELQREAERYRAEALAPETRRPVMPLTLADLAKMAALISSHDLGQ
ncbi:hypothetical protein CYMTET_3323 [Cymbomonas tetramitiformis]|uniref:Reverse transcriptase domain-containing protein n=1 Tax=Cymbomonas tetramitiformis TaxID=36881 RepID=A0AAE0LL77_9CHLO|nr:hypothetical protein CYMTET_3323 [Cymbomonas tetramitiformis]